MLLFLSFLTDRDGLGGWGWAWDENSVADDECETPGWAKFMQWKYPVEVVITSKKTFNAAGAVEVAASL